MPRTSGKAERFITRAHLKGWASLTADQILEEHNRWRPHVIGRPATVRQRCPMATAGLSPHQPHWFGCESL